MKVDVNVGSDSSALIEITEPEVANMGLNIQFSANP